MQRYKLLLAYDGTPYCGWQAQTKTKKKSIQTLVQKALETALRHPVALTGSGRTDAGVHAQGQAAHFDSPIPFAIPRLLHSLNALLPPDIRVLTLEAVSSTFHARYSALSKTYHYHLHLESTIDPFIRLYRTHVRDRFDLSRIRQALPFLIGERDFTSFSNEAYRGCASRDPIRTLYRCEVAEQKGGIRLEFEADGFLYKMVRNIVGTLLDIAASRLDPDQIPSILAAKNRSAAGSTAPAQGLFLVRVAYTLINDRDKTIVPKRGQILNESTFQPPSREPLDRKHLGEIES